MVHDEFGNRASSADGSFDARYPTVFFLGDSTAASLEVDGDETVPAILEQELRRRGKRINVLNFEVRGYGTDQSVRKALHHAERYRPEQIVYLYTDNDVYDSNVLKLPGRPYGKGVYLRRDGAFTAHNYPVPDYQRGFYGAVVVDPRGEPVLYTGTVAPKPAGEVTTVPWRLRLSDRLEDPSHAYRAILGLKRGVWPASEHQRALRAWKHRRADPWQVMNDGPAAVEDVFYALFHGCVDGGAARLVHRNGPGRSPRPWYLRTMRRDPRRSAVVLTFCVSLAVALLVAETVLRLAGRAPVAAPDEATNQLVYEPDPELGWVNKPGVYRFPPYDPEVGPVTLTIWSDHSRATARARPPGPARVALVGGSIMQGWGVSDESTLAWRLQERFPEDCLVNYGTGGYGTYQTLLRLERLLAEPSAVPEAVVFGLGSFHEERNVADGSFLKLLAVYSLRGHVRVPYVTLDERGAGGASSGAATAVAAAPSFGFRRHRPRRLSALEHPPAWDPETACDVRAAAPDGGHLPPGGDGAADPGLLDPGGGASGLSRVPRRGRLLLGRRHARFERAP